MVGLIKGIMFSHLRNAHQPPLGIACFANVLFSNHMIVQRPDGLQGAGVLTDQALEHSLSASLLLVLQTKLLGDPPVPVLEAEEVL